MVTVETLMWATDNLTFSHKGARLCLEFTLHTPKRHVKNPTFYAESYSGTEELLTMAFAFVKAYSKMSCIPIHLQKGE